MTFGCHNCPQKPRYRIILPRCTLCPVAERFLNVWQSFLSKLLTNSTFSPYSVWSLVGIVSSKFQKFKAGIGSRTCAQPRAFDLYHCLQLPRIVSRRPDMFSIVALADLFTTVQVFHCSSLTCKASEPLFLPTKSQSPNHLNLTSDRLARGSSWSFLLNIIFYESTKAASDSGRLCTGS